ncbi:hypothetical protein BH11PSE8_BH11PSE8_06320 [soil metagenome]
MTKPAETDVDSATDYRLSHLQRGGSYDATLAAGPFDAYMAQREQVLLREIVPALFPADKPRYLDFACGTGRITGAVAPMCAEANGVDISPSMLGQARQKFPTVNFVHADLTQGSVDLGTFDLITSFRFFGNAQQDLRVAVLRTLHRLLRPAGRLVINSHRNPHSLAQLFNTLTGGPESGMDLTYFKLKSLLRECGFEIESIRPIAAWMYRFKLQTTTPDPDKAARLEQTFGSSLFATIAPDAIVVVRKIA